MNLAGAPAWNDARPGTHLADAWILSRLQGTIRDASAAVEGYRYNELADTLYHFVWDDFCDWYVEIAKSRINAGEAGPKAILAHCLDVILRLLHPIMPFITEAIWQNLNSVVPCRGPGDQQAEPLLVTAQWPRADAGGINPGAEARFALLRELVRSIRNVRSQHNVPPSKKIEVAAEADADPARVLGENLELVKSLAQLSEFTVRPSGTSAAIPADAAAVAVGGVKLYVMGIVDRQAELARLTKQRETLLRGIKGIEGKLSNEGFLAKAPPRSACGSNP
jgi:valyl-tRNA synthetase